MAGWLAGSLALLVMQPRGFFFSSENLLGKEGGEAGGDGDGEDGGNNLKMCVRIRISDVQWRWSDIYVCVCDCARDAIDFTFPTPSIYRPSFIFPFI